MKDNDESLDQLFADAKQAQNRIAEAAELGVESRLRGKLSQSDDDGELWYQALWRLCTAGGMIAAGLTLWVVIPQAGPQDVTSMLIEQWILGI
ncbi:MAG: hypothetical protein P1V20_06935 [Verrucomicrobiales bacterium]|nr:hypothetical protein [Verrucomicrobiales bacterium]